jgi:hypothetical protein
MMLFSQRVFFNCWNMQRMCQQAVKSRLSGKPNLIIKKAKLSQLRLKRNLFYRVNSRGKRLKLPTLNSARKITGFINSLIPMNPKKLLKGNEFCLTFILKRRLNRG